MPTKSKQPRESTPESATAAAPPAKSPSKAALVLKLLIRTKGATIAEIEEPTGWKPHSARAYLSGLRKKGRTVIREQRKTGETTYRIIDAVGAAAGPGSASKPVADSPALPSNSPVRADSDGDVPADSGRVDDSFCADADAVAAASTKSASA